MPTKRKCCIEQCGKGGTPVDLDRLIKIVERAYLPPENYYLCAPHARALFWEIMKLRNVSKRKVA